MNWCKLTEMQAALSSDALLPSLAVTCLHRFNLSVPYTADSKYGGCRHCIVSLRRNNDTARVLHVRLCSLSRPTLERLSWQRRWTSMLCEQKLCAGARLRYIIEEKTTSSPPRLRSLRPRPRLYQTDVSSE